MKYRVKDGNEVICTKKLSQETIQSIYDAFNEIYNDIDTDEVEDI